MIPKQNRASATPPEAVKAAEEQLAVEERIRRRAHEIYLQRSPGSGSDIDDWLQAEREILDEQSAKEAANRSSAMSSGSRSEES